MYLIFVPILSLCTGTIDEYCYCNLVFIFLIKQDSLQRNLFILMHAPELLQVRNTLFALCFHNLADSFCVW